MSLQVGELEGFRGESLLDSCITLAILFVTWGSEVLGERRVFQGIVVRIRWLMDPKTQVTNHKLFSHLVLYYQP